MSAQCVGGQENCPASMKVPTTVGKCVRLHYKNVGEARASMKALPKRKGNFNSRPDRHNNIIASMKVSARKRRNIC